LFRPWCFIHNSPPKRDEYGAFHDVLNTLVFHDVLNTDTYEIAGIDLDTDDWLSLLGFPPD